MKNKIIITLVFIITIIPLTTEHKKINPVFSYKDYKIKYQTHIQDIGWQTDKFDGETSGTTGQSKRIEGIKLELKEKKYEGNIEYKSYIEGIGFEEEYKKNGEISGTTGKSKRIEAIKIKLSGQIEEIYDVYYRVHVQNLGWLGWCKNDEIAGTTGYDYRIEAIEIKLVNKIDKIEETKPSYYENYIKYQTHISNIGWEDFKNDGETSGTVGKNQIEGIKIKLNREDGSILYRSLIENQGWEEYKKDGELSGTTGEAKKIEAIQIKLEGEIINNYDINYRVYTKSMGWLSWTKNGEVAGTSGYDYQIQSIEIKLTEKNQIDTSQKSYFENPIKYSSHIENIGWQNIKYNGEMTGTTGQSKRIEALKIELDRTIDGDVEYRSYIEGIGLEEYKKNGEISGTTGQAKRIEKIMIRLKGEVEKNYNIYYRVHVQNIGWLGWTKNGNLAGTSGYNYKIEAIEIKMLEKNQELKEETAYLERNIKYQTHISNIGWQDIKYDGLTAGDKKNNIEAIAIDLLKPDLKGNILYRTYISGYGWEENYSKNMNTSGTTGKAKKIECIQIKLDGLVAADYDIYYRVDVENIGWLGWTKNGEYAGTNGYNYGIHQIEIKLQDKNDPPIEENRESYIFTKEGYFMIEKDSRAFDTANATPKNEKTIKMAEKDENINQIWKLVDTKEGYFKIKTAANPNNCLSNIDDNPKIKKCDNSDMTKWKIEENDGYYKISNGKYITDNGEKITLDTEGNNYKIINYKEKKHYRGIDISKWQGNIDWPKMAEENPNFIIMRVGTGRNNYEKDSKFDEYYNMATYYDIPIGAYTYSLAQNLEQAKREAELTLEWLDNKKLDLPVFYDIENISQTLLGKEVLTKIGETFCQKIMNGGYHCGIYANKYFLKDNLNAEELAQKYPIWLAHWTGTDDYNEAINNIQYKSDYELTPYKYWQFSSMGIYKSITENTVDLDIGYDIFD